MTWVPSTHIVRYTCRENIHTQMYIHKHRCTDMVWADIYADIDT